MPNRLRHKSYQFAYMFLAARDGEQCLVCKRAPPRVKLQIDHMDNNTANNEPRNLHLLCQQCNLAARKLSTDAHRKLCLKDSARNVCVCVGVCVCGKRRGDTEFNKRIFDYASGSIEMKLSGILEPRFRDWLTTFLKTEGTIWKSEAINGGAEVVGCSPATAKRYVEKMLSDFGTLIERLDAYGHRVLALRNPPAAPQTKIKAPKISSKGSERDKNNS